MQSFRFPMTDGLKELIRNARENFRWFKVPYTGGPWKSEEQRVDCPTLMLVKDQGVYLMTPFTIESPEVPENVRLRDGDRLLCCYADDNGPETFIGGDDFCENVPIPEGFEGSTAIIVYLTKTQVSVECEMPKEIEPPRKGERHPKGR